MDYFKKRKEKVNYIAGCYETKKGGREGETEHHRALPGSEQLDLTLTQPSLV